MNKPLHHPQTLSSQTLHETLTSLSLASAAPFERSRAQHSKIVKIAAACVAVGCSTLLLAAVMVPSGLTGGLTTAVTTFFASSRSTAPSIVTRDNALVAPAPAKIPIESQPSPKAVIGSGHVVAPATVDVYAHSAGQVIALPVSLGDPVAAGQIVAQLDDAEPRFRAALARNALDAAELTLAGRQIDLLEAQAILKRQQILVAKGVGTAVDQERADATEKRAENAVAQAKLSLDRAKIALDQAQHAVDDLVIRAPISGIVTMLGLHAGQSVLAEPDSSRPKDAILRIADTSHLVIDVDIAESSLARIATGAKGEAVLNAFPDRPFPVTVERLSPAASIEKAALPVRLAIATPPPGLRPDMAVRVTLSSPTRTALERDAP